MEKADVVIIGAGPAGLFAAYELSEKSKLNVLVLEQGKPVDKRNCPAGIIGVAIGECKRCKPCNIMSGVGGAGGLSSCILNLRPDIGGNLTDLTKNERKAWDLVKKVDDVFLKHGAPNELYEPSNTALELSRKAAAAGVKFIQIPQRLVGSDYTPKVLKAIQNTLEKNGVKILADTKVEDFGKGFVRINGKEIKCKYIIAATGRIGASWLEQKASSLGIKFSHEPIDVGVRVEVPNIVIEPVIKINRDPKFHIFTETYDDFVRTFCLHPNEPIFYEDNGILHIDRIKNVPSGASIASVDLDNKKIKMLKPECKTKRFYKGKMVRLKLFKGGEICVTTDHLLLIRDNITPEEMSILTLLRKSGLVRSEEIAKKIGLHVALVRERLKHLLKHGYVRKSMQGKFVFYKWVKDPILKYTPKKATEVKTGQLLPRIRNLPDTAKIISELNLIEEFKKYVPRKFLTKIIVRGTKDYIDEIKRKDLTATYEQLYCKYDHNRLRFLKLIKLIEKYGVKDSYYRKFRLGLTGSIIELPAILPITRDLARILGYFVSEGNYNFNLHHHNYFITFTNNSKTIREEIIQSMKIIGKDVAHYLTSRYHNQVTFPSLLHCLLLKYVFRIPSGAKNKELPRYIFNFDKNIIFSLLKALFKGDGHVGRTGVYYMTTSKMLRAQLGYLLMRLGYPITYRKSTLSAAPNQKIFRRGFEHYIYVSGRAHQINFAKEMLAMDGAGIKNLLSHKPKYWRQVQTRYMKDLFSNEPLLDTKITGIKVFNYEGPVYDFSIPPYRTFVVGNVPVVIHNCTNWSGYVVREMYDGFVGVNGHSLRDIKSPNTNFAFLTRVQLTEPVEDTTAYGRSIAELATTIGGGKPILQRLGDLRKGRRSYWDRIARSGIEPTLKTVTPGDIAMALPHRVVTNIIEGLEKLDKVIPGVASDSVLLYAPEIKFYAMRVEVGKNLETSVENLFVAGDGAGLSRGIVGAAATGILAAEGIMQKEGIK